MPRFKQFASAMAVAATLTMAATPAAAADLPTGLATPLAPGQVSAQFPGMSAYKDDAVNADSYRRYRHRDRVDAGDVIAGVLILGGIAAVASAASKNSRDRDYRDYRDTRYPYRTSDRADYRGGPRSNAGSGIDNAVDMCVGAIERDVRIASVDGVDRSAPGWLVTGTIYSGDAFACRIDGSGRVEGIEYGRSGAAPAYPGGYSGAYAGPVNDRQWDDDRYRAAWASRDAGTYAPPAGTNDTRLPAYPGGPVEGDYTDD